MARDRSLDEFVGESEESAAAGAGDDADDAPADPAPGDDGSGRDSAGGDGDPGAPSGDGPDAGGDASDDAGVEATDPVDAPADVDTEPAAVTYRWEPDGVGCAECGATVDRLWSGASGQVCADCKEW